MALLSLLAPAAASMPKDKQEERPKLPYSMLGLGKDEIDAYDSKAEPVAAATAALVNFNNKGWELIHKYFPSLGTESAKEVRVHPEDPEDLRYFATYLSEDAIRSPVPMLSALWSLPAAELSGKSKALYDAVESAEPLEDYSQWTLEHLRQAVEALTEPAKTVQGVKYRRPKAGLSFGQSMRLYAMTLALIRMETKWSGKTDSPPPDMRDFTSRLGHQLPQRIGDGGSASFFLYRPGVLNHARMKDEFEERADVVVMTRKGATFTVQQFPVYLTADQKEWNPTWITPKDEVNDTTLLARKFEHDWTRLDGPYLWYRPDQLNGAVVYQATAVWANDRFDIQADRAIENRGAVTRVERPPDYDPRLMAPFRPESDKRASAPDRFIADPISLDEQIGGLKSLRFFSNSFRAWCAYGVSATGQAADGKTWVVVLPDPSR